MIFVCGIHGVGKTQYCKMLGIKNGIKSFSASNLIREAGSQNFTGKKVDNIDLNQSLLIEKVQILKDSGIDFILDGHLSLLDKNGQVQLIDENVIRALKIDLLIVLIEKPCIIQKRMRDRDGILWDKHFIERFQQTEVDHARRLGKKLGLDYKIVALPTEDQMNFGESLVLSLLPEYAEKILSGKKKYEFRKNLCRKNIDKIYLYATSPVKKVVGEAEVLEKNCMEKKRLWEHTKKWSGITAEFYEQYFQKQAYACAYKLGASLRYESPMPLETLGINFVPQSCLYINTM